MTQYCQNGPKMAKQLAPAAEKNNTDISAASAAFCISGIDGVGDQDGQWSW